jgi:hypothetical protein
VLIVLGRQQTAVLVYRKSKLVSLPGCEREVENSSRNLIKDLRWMRL